jgi:hypothetical protein
MKLFASDRPPGFVDDFASLGGLEKVRGLVLDLSNAFIVSLLIYILDHQE